MTARWTEADDIRAQRDDWTDAQNDERWSDRNASWQDIYDDTPSAAELDRDEYDAPDTRNRPDPWEAP